METKIEQLVPGMQEYYEHLAKLVKEYQDIYYNQPEMLKTKGESIFNEIHKLTYPYSVTYLKNQSFVYTKEQIEDIMQIMYLEIFKALPKVKEPMAFYELVRQIRRTVVYNYDAKRGTGKVVVRSRSKDGEYSVYVDSLEGLNEKNNGVDTYSVKNVHRGNDENTGEYIEIPENIFDSKESVELLHNIIEETLTPKQRNVIELHAMQGLTFQETADQMGISLSTAKRTHEKALTALKEAIEKLEKKEGIRIHSVAVAPFLVGLFFAYARTQDVSAAEISANYEAVKKAVEINQIAMPSKDMQGADKASGQADNTVNDFSGKETSSNIQGKIANGSKTIGLKTAGAVAGKKIAVAVVCAALAAGGAGIAIHHANAKSENINAVQEEETAKDNIEESVDVPEEKEAEPEESVTSNETEGNVVPLDIIWQTTNDEAREEFYNALSSLTAMQIYYLQLDDSTLEDIKFIAVDMNGWPCLFTYSSETTSLETCKMYTYHPGMGITVLGQANGNGISFVDPEAGVFALVEERDITYTNYYQVSEDGTVNEIASARTLMEGMEDLNPDYTGDTFEMNGQDCSKEELDAYIDSLCENTNKYNDVESRFIVNTPENREEYFHSRNWEGTQWDEQVKRMNHLSEDADSDTTVSGDEETETSESSTTGSDVVIVPLTRESRINGGNRVIDIQDYRITPENAPATADVSSFEPNGVEYFRYVGGEGVGYQYDKNTTSHKNTITKLKIKKNTLYITYSKDYSKTYCEAAIPLTKKCDVEFHRIKPGTDNVSILEKYSAKQVNSRYAEDSSDGCDDFICAYINEDGKIDYLDLDEE